MDGFARFIDNLSLTVIAIGLFAALVAGRELGGWFHRLIEGRADGPIEEAADKSFILTGVLGLLALLIAFTFSLALSRYEERRAIVTAEANAIGTAEMRAHLLPSPQGDGLSRMLRHYARTRLGYGLAPAGGKPELIARSAGERAALQAAAVAGLQPVATNELGVLVAEPLNAVLDVGVEREALDAARVPGSIIAALILYNLITAGALGYALTGARARLRGGTTILFSLLTLAIVLILDLDRPQRGSIRIDQGPMSQLVAGF